MRHNEIKRRTGLDVYKSRTERLKNDTRQLRNGLFLYRTPPLDLVASPRNKLFLVASIV